MSSCFFDCKFTFDFLFFFFSFKWVDYSFLLEAFRDLRSRGMDVEGIFRKEGNWNRLKNIFVCLPFTLLTCRKFVLKKIFPF